MKSFIVSALSFLIAANYSFSQSFDIEFNLKNNDSFKSNFTVETTMKQTIMGIDQNIDMKMEMSYNQQVIDITNDNLYKLKTEFNRVYLHVDYAFDIIKMDTDRHDPSDTLSVMMKELMNKPFTLCLDKTGKIKDLYGFEKYITEISESKNLDSNQHYILSEELKKIMGEELIKQNFTYFFGCYPDIPVRRNESWVVSYPLEQSGMKVFFNGKGVLVEVTSKTFLIRIDGTIETLDSEDGQDQQLFSLSGKQVSEILIDRRNGWPSKSTVTQEISGNLKIMETPADTSSIEVPMQIKMRINMNSTRQ